MTWKIVYLMFPEVPYLGNPVGWVLLVLESLVRMVAAVPVLDILVDPGIQVFEDQMDPAVPEFP